MKGLLPLTGFEKVLILRFHVITCPKCSKENQDHYKFCLGCGAELPRDAAPKPFSPRTPPQGIRPVNPVTNQPPAAGRPASSPPAAAAPAPVAASAPPPTPVSAAPAASGTVVCPQCGHINQPSNTFCGACGFRLGGAAPKPLSAPPAASAPTSGGVLLTALRADGTEAGTFTLPPAPESIVGRDTGGIFAGDSYLSPKHAIFRMKAPGKLSVEDTGSLNGVYRKLAREAPVELQPSDVFRIGQEIVKFESIEPLPASPDGVERLGAPSKGYIGRIALVIGRETTGNAFPIPESGIHIGRERGDVLFPEDGYVSGLHCHIAYEGGRITLTDLGSSNGTFIRLREETQVQSGDVLLMGQQLFRISM
ncbi:MAG TPA: FHA domain-containing protein [Polyangiaceae bacterium]|jgi:pSer/pThr/pTyr-binding forkhead associated (FHA) protein